MENTNRYGLPYVLYSSGIFYEFLQPWIEKGLCKDSLPRKWALLDGGMNEGTYVGVTGDCDRIVMCATVPRRLFDVTATESLRQACFYQMTIYVCDTWGEEKNAIFMGNRRRECEVLEKM